MVSIGSIYGGNRENIVPESVELLGTVRAFDDRMRDDALARMRTAAESIAQASGAKAEVKFLKPGYSATVNDESLTARMLPTLQQVTGRQGRGGAQAERLRGFLRVPEEGARRVLLPRLHRPQARPEGRGAPTTRPSSRSTRPRWPSAPAR